MAISGVASRPPLLTDALCFKLRHCASTSLLSAKTMFIYLHSNLGSMEKDKNGHLYLGIHRSPPSPFNFLEETPLLKNSPTPRNTLCLLRALCHHLAAHFRNYSLMQQILWTEIWQTELRPLLQKLSIICLL